MQNKANPFDKAFMVENNQLEIDPEVYQQKFVYKNQTVAAKPNVGSQGGARNMTQS